MKRTEKYLGELTNLFTTARDKHEANFQSRQLLADMSGDKEFLTEILRAHFRKETVLNTKHYPVVGVEIDINPYFSLVANCWIPLPDRATDVSTKAIHHHGDMLLSTATAFGTGYEHWTFEKPVEFDARREIYKLKVIEREAAHPLHHVAFVDAYVAHLPLYPPDLTITYALWSSRFPTTWKDKVKRVSFLQKNSKRLRDAATKVGLAKQLELKVINYFDFYPTCDGFLGIKERKEFDLGSNEDYLASLFHIVQETGNERLAPEIRAKLNSSGEQFENRALIEKYLSDLETGVKIEGRLSPSHYNVPRANFTKREILEALAAQNNAQKQSSVAAVSPN